MSRVNQGVEVEGEEKWRLSAVYGHDHAKFKNKRTNLLWFILNLQKIKTRHTYYQTQSWDSFLTFNRHQFTVGILLAMEGFVN